MTAAEVEARIRDAHTAHDMHDAAEQSRALDPDMRARLQLLFESQYRLLWPEVFRRRR